MGSLKSPEYLPARANLEDSMEKGAHGPQWKRRQRPAGRTQKRLIGH